MRVSVVDSRCIGSGNCSRIAPEVFDQNDETGIAFVILRQEELSPELEREVTMAAQECPGMAIRHDWEVT